jgi:hypothetical protein
VSIKPTITTTPILTARAPTALIYHAGRMKVTPGRYLTFIEEQNNHVAKSARRKMYAQLVSGTCVFFFSSSYIIVYSSFR